MMMYWWHGASNQLEKAGLTSGCAAFSSLVARLHQPTRSGVPAMR